MNEVETKVLNHAVKRNIKRFPEDFMFQLSEEELEHWRSQIVTSNPSVKMSLRRRPYAFTVYGVSMLSSVLNSPKAININIQIMRVFINYTMRIKEIEIQNFRALAGKYTINLFKSCKNF